MQLTERRRHENAKHGKTSHASSLRKAPMEVRAGWAPVEVVER